jgi:hypothetical protein
MFMQTHKGRSYITILITKVLNSNEAELLNAMFKNFTIFLIFVQLFILIFLSITNTTTELELLKKLDLEEIGLQVAIITSILIYSYSVYAICYAKSIVVTNLFIIFIMYNLVMNLSPFFIIYLLMSIGAFKSVNYYRNLEVFKQDQDQEEDEYYY